jgi:hypothetical protein
MVATIPCEPTIYPLPEYVKEKKFAETNIQFESEGLKMYGALAIPKKVKIGIPIFIFVHGSGPNDKDETVGIPVFLMQGERDYQVTLKDIVKWVKANK